ncbi:MAG TPA: selenocysteine-specific translation elongation factor [Candidatus Acidoferrales bacterium]|nr:selenocysteine-specific translation elongation factor [Candidatus Acidoferrales bacterium]
MQPAKKVSEEAAAKNVIVGTAGHIDHGKSALVEALTGTHPDRLEEERRRGITIDLGFAFLDLGDVRLGFVDVPGHERFVRNMLAGAGGIDLVLFVIAADEGIKPQTREHFDICRLLGIPRGIVVLTKSDLVDSVSRDIVRLEVEDFLRGSFLEGAPIVASSARTREGLPELRETLTRVALQVATKDTRRYFRLPIDRAFAMKGFGTVVTGTLVSGQVSREDEVELHPARRLVRIRGVQSGGQSVERATAGQRTALNLAGVELEDVRRGMVLTVPGRFSATRHLDSRIVLLDSARPLKSGARVHFHQGASHTVARVTLLEEGQLMPGASALAHLVLQEEVFLAPGDRFILRQFSPVVTIGGGTALQTLRRRRLRDPEALHLLTTIERGSKQEILRAMVEAAPEGMSQEAVIARTFWLEDEVLAAAEALQTQKALRILRRAPLLLASTARLEACSTRIRESIAQFHRAKPLADGMSKEDLRTQAADDAGPDIFQAAVNQLVAAGELVISGEMVKRAGRAVALSPEEARARQGIETAFAQSGLLSPSPPEVFAKLGLDSATAQSLMQLLLREKILVKIGDGLIFHANALTQLRQLLASHKQKQGPRISVPTFKELTGVSRKYAIPLLEYLDRSGVTRREGDERVII